MLIYIYIYSKKGKNKQNTTGHKRHKDLSLRFASQVFHQRDFESFFDLQTSEQSSCAILPVHVHLKSETLPLFDRPLLSESFCFCISHFPHILKMMGETAIEKKNYGGTNES